MQVAQQIGRAIFPNKWPRLEAIGDGLLGNLEGERGGWLIEKHRNSLPDCATLLIPTHGDVTTIPDRHIAEAAIVVPVAGLQTVVGNETKFIHGCAVPVIAGEHASLKCALRLAASPFAPCAVLISFFASLAHC